MSLFNLILIIVIFFVLSILMLIAVSKLLKVSSKSFFVGFLGVVIGLLLGALLYLPFSKLPGDFGVWIPLIISFLSTLGTATIFLAKKDTISEAFSGIASIIMGSRTKTASGFLGEILVDTSVLIDGRIDEIAKTGFVPGNLVVPRFILAELQNIADSSDNMRRNRGRRGLEVLKTLRHDTKVKVEITDEDFSDVPEVDAKLVKLAKKRGTDILTTDYNLNRVAKIEGVRVLNINELANAIRPVVLPGEKLKVKVVQSGKERGQGVGYLPDGTMIVVEGGDKMIGKEVDTEVSRALQTVAGKMIFAIPVGKKRIRTERNGNNNNHPKFFRRKRY